MSFRLGPLVFKNKDLMYKVGQFMDRGRLKKN